MAPKLVVDSGNCEMGYEAIAAFPYAYALHLKGELAGTRSGTGSEAFYYFSPHHEINPEPRDFANTAAAAKSIPNTWIHTPRLDKTNWVPPPLKEHYAPSAITFDKPTVVIYNRKNEEWGGPPINFFDLPTLRSLFTMLLPKYDIVYFNVRGREELEDNAHSMDLGDYEMIAAEFPQVHVIHDLIKKHNSDYNTVQLRVFAGCSKFITMNGFPCILASYFGGENIIYSKKCRELTKGVGSFFGWYHDFGGSHIRHVDSYADLLQVVDLAWIKEKPLINILVRCHNRPKGLERLLSSIATQGDHNIRVIASYDNDQTEKYLLSVPITRIKVTPAQKGDRPGSWSDYRGFLPSNEYLNTLMDVVTDGYIMFIDDDDAYEEGSFDHIEKDLHPNRMLLWRIRDRSDVVIPDDAHFGTITAAQISGIAVCFHSSHKDRVRWTPWRRGDYRFIRDLSERVGTWYLDAVLSTAKPRIDDEADTGFRISMKERADHINAIVAEKMALRKALRP